MNRFASSFAYPVVCLSSLLSFESSAADECDLDNGASVFQCAACHRYVPTNLDKSGPNLHGLYGRKSGTLATYRAGYSDAMINAGILWDEDTLDDFLANPGKYVASTAMVFLGVRNGKDRSDLICFLKAATN